MKLDAVKKKIEKLDLEPVMLKLTQSFEDGGFEWPMSEVEELANEYREFLYNSYVNLQSNNKEFGNVRPPSRVMDVFWHTHILFTEKYHQDCADVFGFYLHHEPEMS